MQARSSVFFAITLAAATFSGAVPAQSQLNPSEASLLSGSFLVLVPFALVAASGQSVAKSLSSIGEHSRWKVTDVKEGNAGKTEAQMRCDEKSLKLTMTLPTQTVREKRLAVGDQVDIDRVGKAGYVVKKGEAAIGVLAEPGQGMVHSKPRS